MLLGAGGGDALPFPLLTCCGVAYSLKFELYNHASHFLTVLTLAPRTLPCLPSAVPAPSLGCCLSSSRCKLYQALNTLHGKIHKSIRAGKSALAACSQRKSVRAAGVSLGVSGNLVMGTTYIWSAIRGTGHLKCIRSTAPHGKG